MLSVCHDVVEFSFYCKENSIECQKCTSVEWRLELSKSKGGKDDNSIIIHSDSFTNEIDRTMLLLCYTFNMILCYCNVISSLFDAEFVIYESNIRIIKVYLHLKAQNHCPFITITFSVAYFVFVLPNKLWFGFYYHLSGQVDRNNGNYFFIVPDRRKN